MWRYDRSISLLYSHGDDGCHQIQTGDEDAHLRDERGEQEGPGGLSGGRALPEGGQEGDQAVLGDGLEQARRTRQGLEPRPHRGEEGADKHHPLIGEADLGRYETPAYGLSIPRGKKITEIE